MNNLRLTYLFDQFFHKRATPDEKKEFMELLSKPAYAERIRELMGGAWQGFDAFEEVFSDDQSRAMLEDILSAGSMRRTKVYNMSSGRGFFSRRLAAAAIFVCIGLAAAIYFLNSSPVAGERIADAGSPKAEAAKIVPGGEKAYLTLADGSVIVLDTAENGTVTMQGSSKVMKMDNRLVYDGAGAPSDIPLVYNMISTPRGGEYRIVLADGTRVWLNAASSLRFPIAFTGPERSVSLTGEAYFEVAKNTGKPFKVVLNNETEVEVLGTSFNVMAYDDENMVKTTLVEGEVKISRPGHSVQMLPNQQAVTTHKDSGITIQPADIEEAIAWKEGRFYFNNDNILSIMRQLSRWYNVEVYYTGTIPGGHYEGTIRRQAEIGQVLEILELPGGINFEIKENKIMVSAK